MLPPPDCRQAVRPSFTTASRNKRKYMRAASERKAYHEALALGLALALALGLALAEYSLSALRALSQAWRDQDLRPLLSPCHARRRPLGLHLRRSRESPSSSTWESHLLTDNARSGVEIGRAHV